MGTKDRVKGRRQRASQFFLPRPIHFDHLIHHPQGFHERPKARAADEGDGSLGSPVFDVFKGWDGKEKITKESRLDIKMIDNRLLRLFPAGKDHLLPDGG